MLNRPTPRRLRRSHSPLAGPLRILVFQKKKDEQKTKEVPAGEHVASHSLLPLLLLLLHP